MEETQPDFGEQQAAGLVKGNVKTVWDDFNDGNFSAAIALIILLAIAVAFLLIIKPIIEDISGYSITSSGGIVKMGI